jgi:hypothetical protein
MIQTISPEAVAQLRRFMELREARDVTKKAAENAEKEYRDAEGDVYEALEASPVKGTLKVDLGDPWGVVSFAPRETYFGRIYDDYAALEHFEERAMVDELTTPKFVMKRVNEIVRDCVEQGVKPPPGIDYYARRGVTITRQKT